MKKILILSCRNFGDSVILVELIKNLGNDFEVDILTRKEFMPIFSKEDKVNSIYTANFPMGTMKNFNFKESIRLLKMSLKLRKIDYDHVLNNIGDFRENFIGWVINAPQNISVKWPNNHPFRRLSRAGLDLLVGRYIQIPNNIFNIYEVQKYIACELCKKIQPTKEIKNLQKNKNKINKLAIHPMASQKTRFWKYENWIEVIKEFGRVDNRVIVFCAPHEVKELKFVFHEVENSIEIVAKSIDIFLDTLKSINVFVGLDSFSIHAAYMMDVPNLIMLNGANDARIWAPPKAEVLGGGKNCEFFPCYNRPKCLGKEFEYICMETITPNEVINAIKKKYE